MLGAVCRPCHIPFLVFESFVCGLGQSACDRSQLNKERAEPSWQGLAIQTVQWLLLDIAIPVMKAWQLLEG